MTLAEIKALIDTNIPNNNTGLITPVKERQVMKALADFMVSSQGEVDTAPFVYDPGFPYDADVPVIYSNAWYLSKEAANLNNPPATSPTKWEPINAHNEVLSIYEQGSVYIGDLTLVIKDSTLYQLDRTVAGDVPFVSIDFATELASGQWKVMTSGESGAGGTARFVRGGTWIWKGVGFQFETVDTEYYLPGVADPIVVLATDIDLADYTDEGQLDNSADPQFVAPQWDVNGNVVPIFGEASSDPIQPAVEFPELQIAGTPLLLNAGATSVDPGEVQTQVIFAEGAAGEATLTHTGAGTANYADTAGPIAGTKSANISNPQHNSSEQATFVSDFVPGNFTVIAIKIQLKAVMMAGHSLRIFFRNAANSIISNTVILPVDKNSTAEQTISLPLSNFNFNSTAVKKIELRWYRTSPATAIHPGYRFDDWIFQNGIAPPVLDKEVSLVGHTKGMGKVGENIFTTITEKVISDQTEQTGALPSAAEALFRLPDGSLVKVPASVLNAGNVPVGGYTPPRKVSWTFDGDREFTLPSFGAGWKAASVFIAEHRSLFITEGLDLASDGLSVTLREEWGVGVGDEITMWLFLSYDSETPPEEIPPIEPPAPDPAAITPVVTHFLDRDNFDDVTVGIIDDERYEDLFYDPRGVRSDGDKEVVDVGGKKYIRHGYDEGEYGYGTGMNEWVTIPHTQEAWLAYDITPKDVTLWSLTGKLPGFVVGNFSGDGPFAGGGQTMAGRGGSLRLAPDKNLNIGLYVYAHGAGGGDSFGSDMGLGKFATLVKEVQNRITIRVVMNTGSNADGMIQVWLNGSLVCTCTNVRWRLEDTQADAFMMMANNTFSGGGDERFDTPTSCYFLQSYVHIGIGNGSRVVYKRTDTIILPWETLLFVA